MDKWSCMPLIALTHLRTDWRDLLLTIPIEVENADGYFISSEQNSMNCASLGEGFVTRGCTVGRNEAVW